MCQLLRAYDHIYFCCRVSHVKQKMFLYQLVDLLISNSHYPLTYWNDSELHATEFLFRKRHMLTRCLLILRFNASFLGERGSPFHVLNEREYVWSSLRTFNTEVSDETSGTSLVSSLLASISTVLIEVAISSSVTIEVDDDIDCSLKTLSEIPGNVLWLAVATEPNKYDISAIIMIIINYIIKNYKLPTGVMLSVTDVCTFFNFFYILAYRNTQKCYGTIGKCHLPQILWTYMVGDGEIDVYDVSA